MYMSLTSLFLNSLFCGAPLLKLRLFPCAEMFKYKIVLKNTYRKEMQLPISYSILSFPLETDTSLRLYHPTSLELFSTGECSHE